LEQLYRRGRRIDLDAPGQMALALVISQLLCAADSGIPLARLAAIVTRPMRRLLHVLRPSDELVR
jgi:hypothetical protein